MEQPKIKVRFIKSGTAHGLGYFAGETAMLPKTLAEQITADGIVVKCQQPVKEAGESKAPVVTKKTTTAKKTGSRSRTTKKK